MDLSSMSQKFKKFAGSASTTINRAVQFTEEKLGAAEKTELDAHFENLLQRSDKTRVWTEKVLKGTECVIQPNPNQRMEDMLYEKLEKKKKDRMTASETLGQHMVDAGNDYGPGTAYGNALIKCGQAQMRIGNAEREYVQSTVNNFLQPLKNFLEGDMKTIMKERKLLENKRLDLDACKSRLRKAKSTGAQQQDDVIAKAEADLRVAQSEFDRQAEITKLLLEGINSTHAHHLRCLNNFIEEQGNYYAQCLQYTKDLQSQLGSAPTANTPTSGDMDYSVGSATSMGGGAPSSSMVSNSNSPLMPSAPPAIQVTAPTPTEKKQARVLYDYDAADSSEMSLLADELIMVYKVQGLDEDWLMAERGSQRGKVPVTYLEVLE